MDLPLEMHPMWNPNLGDTERADYVADFHRKFEPDCRKQFLKAQRASWFLAVVGPWLMSLKPDIFHTADFADALGVTREQLWRYSNFEQIPSDEIVYQCLRFSRKSYADMPQITQEAIYPAIGIAAAAQIAQWQKDTTGKPVLRRQRTRKADLLPIADVTLAYPLISDLFFLDRWVSIAWDYQTNITAALCESSFVDLLTEILQKAISLVRTAGAETPVFSGALDELSSLALPSNGPEKILSRVQALWNRHQFTWFCTHDCTSDLHGDLLLD